jgi:hypothetical protein
MGREMKIGARGHGSTAAPLTDLLNFYTGSQVSKFVYLPKGVFPAAAAAQSLFVVYHSQSAALARGKMREAWSHRGGNVFC